MNTTTTIKSYVAVLCTNSEGQPEFYASTLNVTPEDVASGKHFELAKEDATLNGYDEPMIAFDDTALEPIQIGNIMLWLPRRFNDSEQTHVAVLCTNSEGQPEFYASTLDVTPEDVASGKHLELAKEDATLKGYDEPMIAFDDTAPASEQLGDILLWL